MKLRDIIVHLRFPFSFFLLPIFLFALSLLPQINSLEALLYFFSLHFFLYPASNAYNSYYDKDEGPIGGIKSPPKVDKRLLGASLLMELIGLALLAIISPWALIFMFVYGLLSKAYSWDKIRWKKRPIFSLGGIALTQGSLVVLMLAFCSEGGVLSRFPYLELEHGNLAAMNQGSMAATSAYSGAFGFGDPIPWIGALAAALFLCAVYPLTQVYQHEEDAAHGDMTYSRLVGIRGTFLHAACAFILALAGFGTVFVMTQAGDGLRSLLVMALILSPALIYFLWWWARVWKDERQADFGNTMRMNLIASSGMNLYFLIQLLVK